LAPIIAAAAVAAATTTIFSNINHFKLLSKKFALLNQEMLAADSPVRMMGITVSKNKRKNGFTIMEMYNI